ncbi:hypothetical protein OG215_37210 (plasmid) [Streptomyces globisporus]|uniref:hypothetical protein n=1 Tax=Streptomyces globisporus TaxID=1908 RepID=UPI002F9071C4|nr:hypothetical protein OG215_37210 [Streptomyces globisporus]
MNMPRRKTALLLAGSVLTAVLPFVAAAPASAETSMTITSVVLGSSSSVTVSGEYACDGEGYPSKVGVTVDNLDNGNRLFGTSSYAPVCDGNFHSFRVTANKRLAPTPVTFSRGDTAAVTAYLADSSSGYSIVEDSGFYTL